ncbi:hypothetical protein D3C85_830930 [compost metagenome]
MHGVEKTQLLFSLVGHLLAQALFFARLLLGFTAGDFCLLALECKEVVVGAVGVEVPQFAAVVALQSDLVQPGVAVALEQSLGQVAHGVGVDPGFLGSLLVELGERGEQDGADAFGLAKQLGVVGQGQ